MGCILLRTPLTYGRVQDSFGHSISYLRVSITDRCNERCNYCMPNELQEWMPRDEVLTYEELTRIMRVAVTLGINRFRITGGEPLTRREVPSFFQMLQNVEGITSLGVSTNGTLLAKEISPGVSMAALLAQTGVNSLNLSLDTLRRERYAAVTGRDFLDSVLRGIDSAQAAGFEQIKLNCVLMRDQSEDDVLPLIAFAGERGLLLRFIELMPVSTTDVLSEERFFPIAEAKRRIEAKWGALIPEPDFKTNGPANYYRIAETGQRIGFIGAMTDFHFCESCNKLRLTCDGKLRPCLGSHLEFDLKEPLRAGATDEELREFFLHVIARKPKEHDFRTTYQPNRKMVAIGG
ncbi:MAG: GTP 3',8-cyclase MoaA [Chthoniobacterales bacterium]